MTDWEAGKLPLLAMKENATLVGLTDQLPVPFWPAVKLTVMVSGVPVVGVTVTVPL